MRNTWNEAGGMMSSTVFNQALEGLKSFSPVPSIFFGGFGEPLLHPDLAEMIKKAKAVSSRVELITNGTLLDQRAARSLVESGLDMLWISLDGSTPECFSDVRPEASHHQIVENIKYFRSLRPLEQNPKPEIGICFVAMKSNIDELPGVLELAKKLGATSFMISNVVPYTSELNNETLYPRVLLKNRDTPLPWAPHLKVPDVSNLPTLSGIINEAATKGWSIISNTAAHYPASNSYCPFIEEGTTSISWNGNLSPCLPLLYDHTCYLGEKKRSLKKHVIGNITDKNLDRLWKSTDYAAFRKKVQLFEFSPCFSCGGCNNSTENSEDCFGNSFPTCGGCLWAQGLVQCP
jgi:MoaA/NifB/PqqE/SkfB family radical SAM enzyme